MSDVDAMNNGVSAADEAAPTPAQAYDRYLGPAMFEPWSGVLLDMAAPRSGERALDLACGTGIVTRKLAERLGESGEIVAMDINPDMLAVARELAIPPGPSIEWRQGDACAIDEPDSRYDLLVCQQGYQFFPDRAAAAGEMRRVLKDDGRAAVAVWEGLDRHAVFRALFEAEAEHLGVETADLAVPFSLSDPDVLQQEFQAAGFAQVRVTGHRMDARFTDADRFIELVVKSGAAVLPELAEASPEEHQALLAAVRRDAAGVVDRYRDGDGVVFPMYANIVLARC